MAKSMAEIRVTKMGPTGRPYAEVLVDPKIKVAALNGVIERLTKNKDLLRKVGLKACPACKSGLDILVRNRFEHVIDVRG